MQYPFCFYKNWQNQRIKIRGLLIGKGAFSLVQEIIRIEGLECNHCVVRVGRAIVSVQGVVEVDVNLEKREAVVDFEETRTDIGKIREAIREAGYEPL